MHFFFEVLIFNRRFLEQSLQQYIVCSFLHWKSNTVCLMFSIQYIVCSFLQWKSNTVCLMFLHYHFNTNIPYSYQTLCYLQSTFLYKRDRIFPTWNIGNILTDPSDIMIDNIHFLQISYRSWDVNFSQASQSQDYVHIRCTFLYPRKNFLKVKYIFLIWHF